MALYAKVDRSKKRKKGGEGSSDSSPTEPQSPTKTLIDKFNSIGLTNSHHTISCTSSNVPTSKDGKSKLAVIKINNSKGQGVDQDGDPDHKHVIRVTSNPADRPTTLYSSALHQNRHLKSTTSLNSSPPSMTTQGQGEPMYATIGSSNKRLLTSLKSAQV